MFLTLKMSVNLPRQSVIGARHSDYIVYCQCLAEMLSSTKTTDRHSLLYTNKYKQCLYILCSAQQEFSARHSDLYSTTQMFRYNVQLNIHQLSNQVTVKEGNVETQ